MKLRQLGAVTTAVLAVFLLLHGSGLLNSRARAAAVVYRQHLPLMTASRPSCTTQDVFNSMGVRKAETSADRKAVLVTFLSSATSFVVPTAQVGNWTMNYNNAVYTSGTVDLVEERRATLWAPQSCLPLAATTFEREDQLPTPGGFNTDRLMERYTLLKSITVLDGPNGQARLEFLKVAQGQTIQILAGATITYNGNNYTSNFQIGENLTGTYWAPANEKPLLQGSMTRSDPAVPTATATATPSSTAISTATPTPSATPTSTPVSCTGVCTGNDLLSLDWIRSVEITDAQNGQARVRIMPNYMLVEVPVGWTFTYSGVNYTGGTDNALIVLNEEEFATAWAPASAKPLSAPTFTKPIPAVCGVLDVRNLGVFESVTVTDSPNGQASVRFLGAITSFQVPAEWTFVYAGNTYTSGTVNLTSERNGTLWAPQVCKPLSKSRWP